MGGGRPVNLPLLRVLSTSAARQVALIVSRRYPSAVSSLPVLLSRAARGRPVSATGPANNLHLMSERLMGLKVLGSS